MQRKIVAIGGGHNGRIKDDGTKAPYETGPMDLEIIRLAEKEKPNFLFIAHSQTNPESEKNYYETMRRIYADMYGCDCRTITREQLENNDINIVNDIEWADIIYEGGGDTKSMMELWIKTGFDKILRKAWETGKVMCGVSAGGNCWFKSCSSDSLKIQLKDDTAPLINVECLNLVNAFFTPHCDVLDENTSRLEHQKDSFKDKELVGMAISNCAAIEIIDDEYRLITSDAGDYGIEAYGLKTYWRDGKYVEEYIDKSNKFKNLKDLLKVQ